MQTTALRAIDLARRCWRSIDTPLITVTNCTGAQENGKRWPCSIGTDILLILALSFSLRFLTKQPYMQFIFSKELKCHITVQKIDLVQTDTIS